MIVYLRYDNTEYVRVNCNVADAFILSDMESLDSWTLIGGSVNQPGVTQLSVGET